MKSKVIVGLATMLLAVAIPLGVMAAPAHVTSGSEASPADITIAKEYRVPEGLSLPSQSFGFSAELAKLNGVTAPDDLPANVTSRTASITSPTGYTEHNAATSPYQASGKYFAVLGESSGLFAGASWDRTGEYIYTITETAGTAENTTYSLEAYEARVYVKNKADLSGFYASDITVYPSKDATGQVITYADNDAIDAAKVVGDPGRDLVDYIPGGDLRFTNLGRKLTTGEVTMEIVGSYADYNLTWSETVTVEKPSIYTQTTYDYKVLDSKGDEVSTGTGTFGVALPLTVGHKYTIEYSNLPVGSWVNTTQSAKTGYTPSVKVKEYATDTEKLTNGTAGSTLDALGLGKAAPINRTTADLLATDNPGNYAHFYNTIGDTPITGIGSLSQSPWLMAIGLIALAGVGAYLLRKKIAVK